MGSEPKRRHSKARKRTRRAAISLFASYISCKNCGKPTKSHLVCVNCGFYGERSVAKKLVQVTKV